MELGALAQILEEAPATFPVLLSVGKKVESMEMSMLQDMQGKVGSVIEDNCLSIAFLFFVLRR